MIARRLGILCCLLLGLAGCRRPTAHAAELTSGDPGATATPRAEWEAVADLPDCPSSECTGPRMGMPNWTCADGRTGGPVCKRGPSGCAWTVVRCPQADVRVTPMPTPTPVITRTPMPTPTPPRATPTPTRPPASKVMASADAAVADACAKPCGMGQTRRGILRCVDAERVFLRVAGAVNCPAFSMPGREDGRPHGPCAGFFAETACAAREQCVKMDGTCCDDDGTLVMPTGSLGNMYCGSPGQRCSRCKCMPGDALIATPDGDRPIRELSRGDLISTETPDGRRIAAPIVEIANVPAPPGHRLLEVVLEDGRVVRASPTHPAADGAPLESFTPGTRLDGSRVVETRVVPEPVASTFDVLPAGETGIYWADGVRLRSTIPPQGNLFSASP